MALATFGRNHAVQRHRKLECHKRPPMEFTAQIPGHDGTASGWKRPCHHLNPIGAQQRHPGTVCSCVRVSQPHHHTGHLCIHQRLRAGRAAAWMGTGFKRDIDGRAFCSPSRLAQP
jgi:hypothetical protein